MKSQEITRSINFWWRLPWNISLKFKNLWYDIKMQSHISPCLLRSSFNLTWIGMLQCLLIPRQKCTILLCDCFSFLSFISSFVATFSRILPRNQNIIDTAKSETNFIKSQAMANSPKLCHKHTRFLNVGKQMLIPRGGYHESMLTEGTFAYHLFFFHPSCQLFLAG